MPGFESSRACLCCGPVCPRIRRGGWLNAGILGSVHWWLPGWQEREWEQKNMSGRALALQIGSEMAPRPFTGRVNWTLIKHSEGLALPVSEADKSTVQKAAGKSIPDWNINTCNHGSESTLLKQLVHINRFSLATHASYTRLWELLRGVRDNYASFFGAVAFPSSTPTLTCYYFLSWLYNKFMKVWCDCWVSRKSPVISQAQRAPIYCSRSVKLLFNKALRL